MNKNAGRAAGQGLAEPHAPQRGTQKALRHRLPLPLPWLSMSRRECSVSSNSDTRSSPNVGSAFDSAAAVIPCAGIADTRDGPY